MSNKIKDEKSSIVVIPTFNERENIENLIRDILNINLAYRNNPKREKGSIVPCSVPYFDFQDGT